MNSAQLISLRVRILDQSSGLDRVVEYAVPESELVAAVLRRLKDSYGLSGHPLDWTLQHRDEQLLPATTIGEVWNLAGRPAIFDLTLTRIPPEQLGEAQPGAGGDWDREDEDRLFEHSRRPESGTFAAAPGRARGTFPQAPPAPMAAPPVVLSAGPSRSAPKREAAVETTELKVGRDAASDQTRQRVTVRYYDRMHPQRTYPLLVVLSERDLQEIVQKSVRQVQSEDFSVDRQAGVEIEPVLPGCQCYPPRETIAVNDSASTASFWVVPQVLGRIRGAKLIVRQHGQILAEVPLEPKVVKPTLAYVIGLLSFVMPYVNEAAKAHRVDFGTQKAEGFPIYRMAMNWFADHVQPEWLGLGLLGLAGVVYLALRPRKRDQFWDIHLKS